MKKLLFVFLLFISLESLSQTKFLSYVNQYSFWNKYTEKWDWEDLNYANIPINIGEKIIWLENKDKSMFIINSVEPIRNRYSDDKRKYTELVWKVRDMKGRNCRIILLHFEDKSEDLVFAVMYDDVAFRFYIKPNSSSIDSFFN